MGSREVDFGAYSTNIDDEHLASRSGAKQVPTSAFNHRFSPPGGMAATNPYQNTSIPFQLPSFLLGAPTPAAGGGADVLPGSFASLSNFDNWFGSTSTPSANDDYGASKYFSEAKYSSDTMSYKPQITPLVPATREARPTAPFTYNVPPSAASMDPIQPPATPSIQSHPPTPDPSSSTHTSFPTLPPTAEITGPKAPPLYSTTGFDMLSILARVASRPNPTIVLGPVDLSCSFVVVDVRRYDHPIVYASPTFFKLTGYESSEVIGRNCRFLQAPDGNVDKGSARTFTDPAAVAHLKKCLSAGKECQANLMNYRKGGVPFLNLVSIIPIPWDDSDEIQFHVGFQVDLVHQPNAILQTMRDGSYLVNYSTSGGPGSGMVSSRYNAMRGGSGGAALSAPLRELLGHMLPGGASEVAKGSDEQNRADLNVMLLENSDDFVHVFSVKGILQYASPSLLRVLEYTADEIIGKSISEFAHPQDLTPVTRELKEASTFVESANQSGRPVQKTVQLLFGMRRKHSGLIWMESSGRMHMEPGKTRKSIIFSGRLRELPSLTWGMVTQGGGLAALPSSSTASTSEFWAKVSTSTGLFIAAEKSIGEILGVESNDVIGTPFLDVVDPAERRTIMDTIHNFVTGDPSDSPLIISANIISRRDDSRLPSDVIVYPLPRSETFAAVKPAPPSAFIIQFRPRTSGTLQKTFKAPSSSPLYEELDVSKETNWNYEMETIRQDNEQMRTQIAGLLGRREARITSV